MTKVKSLASKIKRGVTDPTSLLNLYYEYRTKYRWNKIDIEDEKKERVNRLESLFGIPANEITQFENDIWSDTTFQEAFEQRWETIEETEGTFETTDTVQAETLYLVTRIVKPDTIINTGVLYGSFAAHILCALEHNGHGELVSIDLENPESTFENGYLIPEHLRDRWTIHLGEASSLLPEVLENNEPIDMSLHDSDHSKEHMKWEFDQGLDHLTDGGVLASHDIIRNNAFENATRDAGMEYVRIGSTGIATCRQL